MTKISEQFMGELASRTRLELSGQEMMDLREQLNTILGYVDALQEVSVEECDDSYNVHPNALELRPDEPRLMGDSGQQLVSRSVGATDGFYRVPRVLEQEES